MRTRRFLHIPPATTIDLDRRQVRRGGRTTRLTALEVRLLSYLWDHRERTVPTEELLVEVWGYSPGTVTRAVESTIRRLRHKLEAEPAVPAHILEVEDQGYQLAGIGESREPPDALDGPRPSAEIVDPTALGDERDPLTGLPCRSTLLELIDRQLQQRGSEPLSVLVCALDRLRHINAAMGLAAGDALLARASQRLRAAADPHLVGRFAGNAFVVVAAGLGSEAAVLDLAESLLREIEAPFELDSRLCHIGLDIGIALSPGVDSAEQLIRRATLALEEAEKTGPGRLVLFDKELAERTEDNAEIEAALSRAIEENQLSLHYQPIFELRSGRIRALEALLRWRRPGFGVVRPDRFIPIAEQSSLIARLQEWVLPRALAELGQVGAGDPGGGPDIWINVSGHTLSRPDIASSTALWLEEADVAPERVTLELTETGLLRDEEAARRTLGELREVGVQLAIDDFGTGYASLTHLVRFPVGVLKIDKSFVQPLGEIDESVSIAATIIEAGRHFDLEVVAEGVERPSQLAALGRLGCDLAQGNLLCPPSRLEDLGEIARRTLDPALLPTH